MAGDRVRIDLDLDGLERRISSDHNARLSRAQSLALIARIRELHAALTSVCDETARDPEHWRRVNDARGVLGGANSSRLAAMASVVGAVEQYVDAGCAGEATDVACDLQMAVHEWRKVKEGE